MVGEASEMAAPMWPVTRNPANPALPHPAHSLRSMHGLPDDQNLQDSKIRSRVWGSVPVIAVKEGTPLTVLAQGTFLSSCMSQLCQPCAISSAHPTMFNLAKGRRPHTCAPKRNIPHIPSHVHLRTGADTCTRMQTQVHN